jgi:hypothetical protein
VSGTPTEQRHEAIDIVIPAEWLDRDTNLPVFNGGQAAPRAKFEIGESWTSTILGATSSAHSNQNWIDPNWSLNTPRLPEVVNFEPVGIVMVKKESIQKLNENGESYWQGERVTYSDLMTEAQRLNAHAIINVLIDYEDISDTTTEIRDVEEGHVLTPTEQAQKRLGLLDDSNPRRYTVRSPRITRIYTGTALAIRYKTDVNSLTYPPVKEE